MTVEFLPQARIEWADAISYYNDQRSNLGYEFALEVDRTVERILQHPHAWTLIAKRTRRALVDRFPYNAGQLPILTRIHDVYTLAS